jgi:uncharacterized surface protein with fasciclin (FAS1) repeats
MTISKKFMTFGILAMFAASVSACSQCGCTPAKSSCSATTATKLHTHTNNADIVATAAHAGNFNTLLAAAKAAGLVDALKSPGPITVFAPTDEAFAKLPKGTVQSLLKPENREQLRQILTYHVVPGAVNAKAVTGMANSNTLSGLHITFNSSDKGVYVNNARVIKADIAATNGVIHVVDTVMLPQDIIGTAVNSGKFNTLVAAIKAAGLTDALRGDKPLTVFAPTDEAFAKLPKGTVESLLKPENKEQLVSILTYHVLSGKVSLQQKTATLQGDSVSISSNCPIMVNNAKVLISDIDVTNGVIHAIDTVLLPKTDSSQRVAKAQ